MEQSGSSQGSTESVELDTKLKGDIAEQAIILQALKMGWEILKPIGDRLPYDLVIDVEGKLVKIQSKNAWFDKNRKFFLIDTRRTKTNRRVMRRDEYNNKDFDFAIAYVHPLELFFVIPVDDFLSFKSSVYLQAASNKKRQRKPKASKYRNAWNLIQNWAVSEETLACTPVKFGEACKMVIPSQVPKGKGVET